MDNTEIEIVEDIESMGNTATPPVLPHEMATKDDVENKPPASIINKLYPAITGNDGKTIKEILDNCSIDTISSRYLQAILKSAMRHNCSIDTIEYLIDRLPHEALAYSNPEMDPRSCSAINSTIFKCDFQTTRMLLSKDPALLNSRDSEGNTPVVFALSINNIDMAYYLLEFSSILQDEEEFQLTMIEILEAAFKHGVYDLAFNLCHRYHKLALEISTWEILIQYSDGFSYKRQLTIMQSIIYSMIRINAETVEASIHHPWEKANSRFSNSNADGQKIKKNKKMLELIITLKRRYFRVPLITNIRRLKLMHYQRLELLKELSMVMEMSAYSNIRDIALRVFSSAIHNGAYDIVHLILHIFWDNYLMFKLNIP